MALPRTRAYTLSAQLQIIFSLIKPEVFLLTGDNEQNKQQTLVKVDIYQSYVFISLKGLELVSL